jgi:hypothetical protein
MNTIAGNRVYTPDMRGNIVRYHSPIGTKHKGDFDVGMLRLGADLVASPQMLILFARDSSQA